MKDQKGLENEKHTRKGLKWTEDHKRLENEQKTTKDLRMPQRQERFPSSDHQLIYYLIVSEKVCVCQGDEKELHHHTTINWPLSQGDPSQFDQCPHAGSCDQQRFVLVAKLVVVLNLGTHCTELSWTNPLTGAGQYATIKQKKSFLWVLCHSSVGLFQFCVIVNNRTRKSESSWINLQTENYVHMYVCVYILSVSFYIVWLWITERTNLNHLESVYRPTTMCARMYVSTS